MKHPKFAALSLPIALFSLSLSSFEYSLSAAPASQYAEMVPKLVDPTQTPFKLARPTPQSAEMKLVQTYEFGPVLQLKVKAETDRASDVQLWSLGEAPVAKDDVLVASFWMRGKPTLNPVTGKAQVQFVFWGSTLASKFIETTVNAEDKWQRYNIPFQATEALGKNGGHIGFNLGLKAQEVEIRNISVANLAKTVALADVKTLPEKSKDPVTSGKFYNVDDEGKTGASWRKEAQARIEQHRKANFRVLVKNKSGKPVSGATVKIAMQRHAFGFGSAVEPKRLLGEEPDQKKYAETVKTWFNEAQFEGDLMWRSWEMTARRERMFKALDWFEQNKIKLHGAHVVWPGWRWMPGENRVDLEKDPDGVKANYFKIKNDYGVGKTYATGTLARAAAKEWLRKRVLDHVTEKVGLLKGRIHSWNVINEPYSFHDLMDVLGDDEMVEWFKAARAADPNAKLYINDYDNLEENIPHLEAYEKTIKFLLSKGAPLDGIGLQSHFFAKPVAISKIWETLDRFAQLGKPIKITEYDMPYRNNEMRPHFTRDFMTAAFSHPSVNAIHIWGFWEGHHWHPDVPMAMLEKDWTLKPNGQAWRDLVFKEWWTNVEAKTFEGEYSTRAFLGDYEITVAHGGKTKTVKTTLTSDGELVSVVLD